MQIPTNDYTAVGVCKSAYPVKLSKLGSASDKSLHFVQSITNYVFF